MMVADKDGEKQKKQPYRSRYQDTDGAYQSPFQDLTGFLKAHGKMIVRILGIIGLIVSVYFLIGGIVCLSQNSMARNADGNYPTWSLNFKTDSHAIVFKADGGWTIADDMGYVEMNVTSANGKEIFIGMASSSPVEDYLSSMSYEEVIGLSIFPDNAGLTAVPGGTPVTAPVDQLYWGQYLMGTATRTIGWATDSNMTVIIMNADGSSGVDVDTTIWTWAAYRFLTGVSNLTIAIFAGLLSLFAVLYTRKSRNSVYPMPLETVWEEKRKKKENRWKWPFGK